MRIISTELPPVSFELKDGAVIFYRYIKSISKTDIMTGREIVMYEYDEYTLPVKNSVSLAAMIESDYENWLEKARLYEYDIESDKVRAYRDKLLDDCDIRHCNPEKWDLMSEEIRDKWRVYKQELRDTPQQEGFPFRVKWPLLPV